MKTQNVLIDLSDLEIVNISGGFGPPPGSWGPWGIAATVAVLAIGACYSAGEACGKALYRITH